MLELLVGINQALYCVALFFQIANNAQHKKTDLSDLFLCAMTNAYVFFTFYFICLRLPIGYQISVIVQLLASLFLVYQRFVYNNDARSIRGLLVWCCCNAIAFVAFIPYAYTHASVVGQVAGWCALLLIISCRIPQALKIYRTKKVENFSKPYVVVVLGAAAMEFCIAISFALPIQTVCSSSLTLLASILFVIQFKLYSR